MIHFCFRQRRRRQWNRRGEKICANAAAKETFLKWLLVYEADGKLDYKEVLKAADTAAKEAGIASYTADLLIYLLMTAHLKERYQEKGISEQIWLDSCMDLNWKLYECRKMYGIWGSFVSWWFDGFFEMTRFALGRLQFELMDFPESYEKDRTCAPGRHDKGHQYAHSVLWTVEKKRTARHRFGRRQRFLRTRFREKKSPFSVNRGCCIRAIANF